MIAIDPGTRATGLAIFDGQHLVFADLITCANGDPFQRIHTISAVVDTYAARHTLVIEFPQVYRATKSKGDPNDLLLVAALAGAIGAQRTNTVYYSPSEWIGQVPKATKKGADSPRRRLILSRLDPNERYLVDVANHDTLDAVGIGLYHLGRLDRKRVFAGAT